MIELATIGYERAGVEDFVATLKAAGVRVLIDVRAVPWSQRPEFRQAALRATLAAAGIGYAHLPGLGNPRRRGRAERRAIDSAGRAGDAAPDAEPGPPGRGPGAEDFAAFFRRHLASETAAPDLARAAALARQGGACLMCLEKDPNRCHRRFVAEALATIAPLTVRHLVVEAAPRQMKLFSDHDDYQNRGK